MFRLWIIMKVFVTIVLLRLRCSGRADFEMHHQFTNKGINQKKILLESYSMYCYLKNWEAILCLVKIQCYRKWWQFLETSAQNSLIRSFRSASFIWSRFTLASQYKDWKFCLYNLFQIWFISGIIKTLKEFYIHYLRNFIFKILFLFISIKGYFIVMCLFLKTCKVRVKGQFIYVILTNYPLWSLSYSYNFQSSFYFMSILQHGNEFWLVRTY